MINLDKKMKECMKPHSLMHSLSGFGVGLVVVGLYPALLGSAVMLGLVLLVVGIVGDLMVNKG